MNTPSAVPEDKKCPQCSAALPAGALAGLCPACLLKQGAAGDTMPPVAFVPPSLEELARLFPQLEILALIGTGGMGAVYKARQKELDRVVALKILPPGAGDSPAFADRFTREAKALARLNHPGIVTIHDTGRVDGLYYFLMEFVDGVNLRQLLKTGRLAPREALAIVPQICDALQYAHDAGIVHRDIKPENILLDRQGRVKVADFGLAKLVGTVEPPAAGVAATQSETTKAGQVMGTPQYMAPEQREHPSDVDHRADIYSLGVVFYQMLTGELPGKQLEPPSSRMRGIVIDVRLDEVVLRALEKQPARRYQQASDVKTIVETIATTPEGRGPSRPPPPAKYNWRTWSPFQSPDVREICTHLTDAESNEIRRRGALSGIWLFVLPFLFLIAGIQSHNAGVLYATAGGLVLFYVGFVLISQMRNRQFLCSTDWARKQGITPDKLRLFSFPWRSAKKLASTAPPPLKSEPVVSYAGFWCRAWALVIDWVLASCVAFLVLLALARYAPDHVVVSSPVGKFASEHIIETKQVTRQNADGSTTAVEERIVEVTNLGRWKYLYRDKIEHNGGKEEKSRQLIDPVTRQDREALQLDKLTLLFYLIYLVLLESSPLQASLGKRVCRIKVVEKHGQPVGVLRAAGRNLGKVLSAVIFCIGFMMAGWTKQKQALHDMMAKCYVVHVNAPGNRHSVGGWVRVVLLGLAIAILAGWQFAHQQQASTSIPVGARNAPVAYVPPTSEQELVTRLESALKASDKAAILALFNWQGVPDDLKAFGFKTFDPMLEHKSEDMHFQVWLRPLPEDYEVENVKDGIRYTPNVTLLGIIDANVSGKLNGKDVNQGVTIAYGKKDGTYYIAGTAAKKIYEPKTKEKYFYVRVQGVVAPDSAIFTGVCTYVQNGKEIKKSITGRGAANKSFFGDDLKSCVVQKTAGERSIQLIILENGKKIFESPEVKGNEPIIYEGPKQPAGESPAPGGGR